MTTTNYSSDQKLDAVGNSDYLRSLGYHDLSIEVNDQCNFHCVYCPYDTDKSHEFAVMDQGKAQEVIDQISEDRALDRYLLFNILGEPLMYTGLFDLIKYAHRKGLKTKLVTNGSLLTKGNIAALIDANPTMLKISVESLDEKVFNEYRGTSIRFENYAKRIAAMIDGTVNAGPEFTTYLQLDLMYSQPLNYALKRMCGLATQDDGRKNTYTNKTKVLDDLKSFLNQAAESGDSMGPPADALSFDQKAFANNDLPLVTLAPNIAFHIKPYERWVDVFARPYPVDNSGQGCPVDNLSIHANGDVALCCVDYNASTKIGNVFHQTLPDILADPKNIKIIQDLRRGVFHFDACKSCQGHSTLLGKYVLGAKRNKTITRLYRAAASMNPINAR
jgi:radical SAM protein with 4Fe4S-binding SPASM domain